MIVLSSPVQHLVFQGTLDICFPLFTQKGNLELPWIHSLQPCSCLFWSFIKKGQDGELYLRAEEIRHTPLTFLPANGSHTWAGPEPGDPQTHLDDFTEIIWPAYSEASDELRCAASQHHRHGQRDQRLLPVLQLRVLHGLPGPHSRGREEADSPQT